MKIQEIILIGVKRTVCAVSKADGAILWTTQLAGGMGDFVTLACDGETVFAHTSGQLYGLNLTNGQILWANELRGYGYGLASICIPGMPSAPELGAVRTIQSQQESANAGAAAT